MEKNFTDPIVKRGTALKLNRGVKRSGFRKTMGCIVKVLFWRWFWIKNSRSNMISTKKRITKYTSNKSAAKHHNWPKIINMVHWDSMQIGNWFNQSQDIQQNISKPEASHEMLVNFSMYIDKPMKVLKSGSE